MSSITFHSPSGAVDVRGPERFSFARYANDALISALGLQGLEDVAWTRSIGKLLAPPPTYRIDSAETLKTLLSVSERAAFRVEGTTIAATALGLNTLIATGSDPMILAARIHGQCEIHAYVEGRNRAWLALIIDRGMESGIYRQGMGWEAVSGLLRSNAKAPVVLAYSVCESFPSQEAARRGGWAPKTADEDEEWYELPAKKQWDWAITGIRATRGLELCPDEWAWPDFFFDAPVTAFQVASSAG